MEDGVHVTLLSVGVVADDGREYYAENANADWSLANAFDQANVLPRLRRAGVAVRAPAVIRDALLAFIVGEPPDFWGYYCAYDRVLFRQFLGCRGHLPQRGSDPTPGWRHPPRTVGRREPATAPHAA